MTVMEDVIKAANDESYVNMTSVGGRRKSRKGKKVKKSTSHKRSSKKGKFNVKKLKSNLSKWINHVKTFAKTHKMKYPQALKDLRCRMSFKKR